MAIGMIKQCKVCDKSYDEGRGFHICDGGEAKRNKQKALDAFNRMSVDDRLEWVYRNIIALRSRLHNVADKIDFPIR